jgi:hypothetical protein
MGELKSGGEPLESFDLHGAYAAKEKELSARLGLGGQLTDHGSIVGAGTEHGWYGFLTGFLPRRYGAATGKVVDSRGHQSEQVDLIVYDAFYSPLLFIVGESTFVPAESVYAVFEVKQTLNKDHLDAAAQKAESVRRLHRTSAFIPNQFGKKDLRKDLDDLPILAGILTSGSQWQTPYHDVLYGHLSAQPLARAIDLGCALGDGAFDTKRDPVSAGRGLRELTVSVPDRSLSYFTMKLLHKLQQLGTVGAIDYEAYAEPLIQDEAPEN